jgi:hypothetical protein
MLKAKEKVKAKKKQGLPAKVKLAFTPAHVTLAVRVLRKIQKERVLDNADTLELFKADTLELFKKSLKTLELK